MFRKIVLTILLLCGLTSFSFSQTTVSATVKDSNNTLYANCTVNVNLVDSSGNSLQNAYVTGTSTPYPTTATTACNSSGVMSIVLLGNASLSPSGTQWNFSICSSNGLSCFTSANTITGSTQSLTSTFQSAAPVLSGGVSTVKTLKISTTAGSGTPGVTAGPWFTETGATWTDSATAGSGTAAAMAFNTVAGSTLAATNTSVTTTNAYLWYLDAPPTAGTNETITNAWSLGINGAAKIITGGLTVAAGGFTVTGNSTIAGTLGGLTGLTVASGGETITSGNLTLTSGNQTLTSGNLTLSAGAISHTPAATSGTPGVATGPWINQATATFTDNATAGSGTATAMAFNVINAPTLAATNASVTTTNAYNTYIAGPPTAGTNETLTNAWALGLNGAVRIITGGETIAAGNLLLSAGTITGTSNSANALAVGLAGATNPALNVDASTASSATGLNIKSAAATGGLAVSVISSGAAENLTVDAKGAGTIKLGGTSTGQISIGRGNLGVPIFSTTTASLGTAQNSTPTAAQLLGGVVTQTSATGAGTVTLPTGTLLSGAVTGVAVGDTFSVMFANLGGGFTLTITGASGSTVVGNGAIASGKNGSLLFVNTGANTWNVYVIPSA